MLRGLLAFDQFLHRVAQVAERDLAYDIPLRAGRFGGEGGGVEELRFAVDLVETHHGVDRVRADRHFGRDAFPRCGGGVSHGSGVVLAGGKAENGNDGERREEMFHHGARFVGAG